MFSSRFVCAAVVTLWAGCALAIPEGPEPNSPEWAQREAQNFARVSEGPQEQLASPDFLQRWQTQSLTNLQAYLARMRARPAWQRALAKGGPVLMSS